MIWSEDPNTEMECDKCGTTWKLKKSISCPKCNGVDGGLTATLPYCAGLVDGEGCVRIAKSTYGIRKTKDCISPTYSERLQLRMTDEATIKFFADVFGGSYYKEKRAYSNSQKPLFVYNVSDKRAYEIIKKLYPYLKIKRKQADILFKLRESKNSPEAKKRGSPAKRSMNKNIVKYREELFKECKKLNSG